jgi:hypothetical protein
MRYNEILTDILQNHSIISDEDLDLKLKEFYDSIPFGTDIYTPRLNQIIKARFPSPSEHHRIFHIPPTKLVTKCKL